MASRRFLEARQRRPMIRFHSVIRRCTGASRQPRSPRQKHRPIRCSSMRPTNRAPSLAKLERDSCEAGGDARREPSSPDRIRNLFDEEDGVAAVAETFEIGPSNWIGASALPDPGRGQYAYSGAERLASSGRHRAGVGGSCRVESSHWSNGSKAPIAASRLCGCGCLQLHSRRRSILDQYSLESKMAASVGVMSERASSVAHQTGMSRALLRFTR